MIKWCTKETLNLPSNGNFVPFGIASVTKLRKMACVSKVVRPNVVCKLLISSFFAIDYCILPHFLFSISVAAEGCEDSGDAERRDDISRNNDNPNVVS